MIVVALVVTVTVAIGVTAQRLTGLGFALLAAPVLVLLLGPLHGVLVVNVTSIASAVIVMSRVWRDIEWRSSVIMAACALAGIVPGALAAVALDRSALEIAVGATLAAALIVTAAIRRRPPNDNPHPVGLGVAGFVSGLTNSAAGVGGPPIALFAALSGWRHVAFAATLQPFFATIGALSAGTKGVLDPAGLVGTRRTRTAAGARCVLAGW